MGFLKELIDELFDANERTCEVCGNLFKSCRRSLIGSDHLYFHNRCHSCRQKKAEVKDKTV